MGKEGHQRGEAFGLPLPLGQQMVASLQGRQRLGKGFLANGVLAGDGAELDPGQPQQGRIAVQHAIRLAPGAIEQDEADLAALVVLYDSLSHLIQPQSLLVGPEQITVHLGIRQQGIEPFSPGKVFSHMNTGLGQGRGQQSGCTLGMPCFARVLQNMKGSEMGYLPNIITKAGFEGSGATCTVSTVLVVGPFHVV